MTIINIRYPDGIVDTIDTETETVVKINTEYYYKIVNGLLYYNIGRGRLYRLEDVRYVPIIDYLEPVVENELDYFVDNTTTHIIVQKTEQRLTKRINIDATYTVQDVLNLLYAYGFIPPKDSFELVFRGQVLQRDIPILEYKVRTEEGPVFVLDNPSLETAPPTTYKQEETINVSIFHEGRKRINITVNETTIKDIRETLGISSDLYAVINNRSFPFNLIVLGDSERLNTNTVKDLKEKVIMLHFSPSFEDLFNFCV